MLKSQVAASARNEDWGRENKYSGFALKQYTKQESDFMDMWHCDPDILKMQFPEFKIPTEIPWAQLAKKEGHKRKLPPSPAPKDQSAEGGRMSRRYLGVKGRVYEAVKELGELSTVNEVVAYTGENKSTVREWFRFFRTSGVFVQQQKKGNEYGYTVNKSLNNKEECA